MNLWNEAQSGYAYEPALQQALALNDKESQADAVAALWRITGNQAQYDRAVGLYQEIGKTDKLAKLQQ